MTAPRRDSYDSPMTDRVRVLLQDALTLSEDERLDLAEQLLTSLPVDTEWMNEIERRARRALVDPSGGEAWDVVERRLAARRPAGFATGAAGAGRSR